MAKSHVEVGVCGLSCRLCPRYHTDGSSRCGGCKGEFRMGAGCPFITCAVKRKGIEYCGDCPEKGACDKWKLHRERGKSHDSFVCYQKLDQNIAHIEKSGIDAFDEEQKNRERLLSIMLREFNEGRSKNYYCIAATVLEPAELEEAISKSRAVSKGKGDKLRSKALHEELEAIAERRGYLLKLRK